MNFDEVARLRKIIQHDPNSIYNKKTFELNNYGNHERDFTYIEDVIDILILIMKKKFNKLHNIFNVCSNRPQNIMNLAKYINENIGKFKILITFKKIVFSSNFPIFLEKVSLLFFVFHCSYTPPPYG